MRERVDAHVSYSVDIAVTDVIITRHACAHAGVHTTWEEARQYAIDELEALIGLAEDSREEIKSAGSYEAWIGKGETRD